MPDHVHLILTPLADEDGSFPVSQITHAIKSESAHRINKNRKGKVWQDESFDHGGSGEEPYRISVALAAARTHA
jgi:REP element-mobilizing transposase RayT